MTAFFAAALLAGIASASELRSYSRQGNFFRLELTEGAADLEWISASTFRFRRVWSGETGEQPPAPQAAVDLRIQDNSDVLLLESPDLHFALRKQGVLLRVANAGGRLLIEDLTEPAYSGGTVRWDRVSPADVQYYGLGPRTDDLLGLRGRRIAAGVPFLMASSGYGERHFAPGSYSYDFRRPERYSVEIENRGMIDFSLCYGPAPKEIFEEHYRAAGTTEIFEPRVLPARRPGPTGNWETLSAWLKRALHLTLSGTVVAEFDLSPYAEGLLFRRASQIAAVTPVVHGMPENSAMRLRESLGMYFDAYREEAHERGTPYLRPLAFQYRSDAEGARRTDQFMIGDELLAAPVLSPDGVRSVYLPMGIWTRLGTGERYNGRQTIRIQADPGELPLFAHNGTIVPLAARSGVLALHYFPKLGGEFFLMEGGGQYSQVHASPAGDFMRLEVESKVEREYEWVVHHAAPVESMESGGKLLAEAAALGALKPDCWFFDAPSGSLHVRLRVKAGEDRIVNISPK